MSSKRSLTERNVEPEFESNLKKAKLTTDEQTEEITNYHVIQQYDHKDVICFFRDQLKLDINRISLDSNKKFPLDGLVLFVFCNTFKTFRRTSTIDGALKSASPILKPYFIDEEESNAAELVGWMLVSFFGLHKDVEEKASFENVPNIPEEVEEYYEESWRKWTGKQSFQKVTEEELEDSRKRFSDTLNYTILPLEKNEHFVKALPIKQENGKGQLAKHYLPFLPSLHITDANDTKLENLSCSNVVVMSPSGMGKTSLMIRTLCKHVGLLITGTGKNEFGNGETVDESVRSMLNCFGSEKEAHAYVRQATLLLMISKLFHIINLIDIAKKNPSILETFEGNLLAFLAFNQFNGNNKNITPIFDYLFIRFKDVICNDLRKYIMYLIEKVKVNTKASTFLICVDEANILEEHGFKFLSVNGYKRGLLSVWCNEIMKVNGKGLNIYAGTSFSINIGDIVQSNLGKTEGELKLMRLVEFEYFDSPAFIDYLKSHVIISDEIKCNPDNFPLRIRQVALCLEYYINSILEGKRKSIEVCLEDSFTKLLTSLETKAKAFINTFPATIKPHCQQMYSSNLFDYIIHHKYPETYGSSFYVPESHMAIHFLSSGIACPVSATLEGNEKQVEFRAVDVLGYKFALKFLGIDNPGSAEKLQLAKYIGTHTHCRKRFEFSLCLALTAVKGKLRDLMDISSTKINWKLQQTLAQTDFECEKIFTSNGFSEYCKKQKWIESSDTTSGEKLYFDFAINFKERIANIIFRPSDDEHDDAIIALIVKEDLVFLRFSFQCLTGKDKRIEEGYKSTLPELMYFDNYKLISLDSLETLVQKDHTKKLPITVTTISQLGANVRFTWGHSSLFEQFLSLYINKSLSVVFHPSTNESQSRESTKYHNAVFIHSTKEVTKLLGSDYTTTCLIPFLETMKKFDSEKDSSYVLTILPSSLQLIRRNRLYRQIS